MAPPGPLAAQGPQPHPRPATLPVAAPPTPLLRRARRRARLSCTSRYIGIAPNCTLISAKIADDRGEATTADLLRGLQWIYNNRAGYGGSGPIKVVNLSITAGTAESYRTSAVCAAVEQLWFSGVTVVCA